MKMKTKKDSSAICQHVKDSVASEMGSGGWGAEGGRALPPHFSSSVTSHAKRRLLKRGSKPLMYSKFQ